MADYVGTFDPALSSAVGVSGARFLVGTISPNAPGTRVLPSDAVDTGWLLAATTPISGISEITEEGDVSVPSVTFAGVLDLGPHEHWFEHLLALPASLPLGNLLTTILRDLELYSSYRRVVVELQTAINNAGTGISFVGLPTLPFLLGFNDGIVFQVQITMQGPSVIDGTLDFGLSVGSVVVPITGARVIMLPYTPEAPIIEILEFLTSIVEAADGTEHRAALRKNPRQLFQLRFMMEDSHLRRKFEALLYNWQAQVFGIPVWFEARYLNTTLSIGSLIASVNTQYADFRIGGLCILWTDEETFESLEIADMDANSITFSSETTVLHTGGVTLVMPLRLGMTKENVTINRYPVGLEILAMNVMLTDNDANLASTTAFGTHNSKVLLDEPNLMQGDTVDFSFIRRIEQIDNAVGLQIQFTGWEASHLEHEKGFFANTAQRLWEIRQLVHALRGSQVSFYLPTYYKDLNVVADLTSGQLVVDIEHIGYTDYIQGLEPLKSLRVELLSGIVLLRQVMSAVVLSSTTERLTIDVAWPYTVPIVAIARVSFVMLCRISDDRVTFTHQRPGEALVTMTVAGVPQ